MENNLMANARQNTRACEELKERYKGVGPLLRGIIFEIYAAIDDSDPDDVIFERLTGMSYMANILEERLVEKNRDVVERETVDFVLNMLETNLCARLDMNRLIGIACEGGIAKSDVHSAIIEALDELDVMP